MTIGSILALLGRGTLKGIKIGDTLEVGGILGTVFKAITVAGEMFDHSGSEKNAVATKQVIMAYPQAPAEKVAMAITLIVEAMKLLDKAEVK
jgi:hypothetical protein